MSLRRAALIAALAAACGGTSQLAGPGLAGGPPPPAKAFPSGKPAALVIGAGGGSVALGALTVTVPAGAVAQDTDFTIAALGSNTAVGAVGTAYDVEAAGTVNKPVTLTFAVADSTGLAASHQIEAGYWLRAYVTDDTPTTVSVTTSQLGAWTLVTAATQRDLHGPFRLDSTLQEIPISVTGEATLQFIGEEAPAFTYFIPTGTISVASPGCVTPPDAALPLSLAETNTASTVTEFQFRWAMDAQWYLDCGSSFHLVSPGFDTMGIYNQGCSLSYTGAMPVSTSPDHLSGQFVIDCGARGRATASWDFVAPSATPGPLPAP